jgi:predicted dehydrogenase/nucleoside-diphosphate-sugar epimerase
MARHHAHALGRCRREVQLVGVADPDTGSREGFLAEFPEATGFSSHRELLDAVTVDAVHVCTPPATHVDVAIDALEAGCHVYVEKPFAETGRDARRVIEAAAQLGLCVCPGHQLLFERPSRETEALMPALGDLVHVESFFSFRPVKIRAGGRVGLSTDQQLLDILPHPVYVLLRFLELGWPRGEVRLSALEVGPAGTVHALVRRGQLAGSLVVTLEGRPVDSHLRVVGDNGTVVADYVRGTTIRAVGPGASGIDKALEPYRQARQLLGKTTRALTRRVVGRGGSYPGLVEIFDAFHAWLQTEAEPPVSHDNILQTVEICEEVARSLKHVAPVAIPVGQASEPHGDRPGLRIAVTGGTGFLGRKVVEQLLREPGVQVRVLSRRHPAPWEAVRDVEHLRVDLARDALHESLIGVDAVVHCAAATAGGWEAHQASSLDATERLLHAAAEAGVRRVIHVSSLAVLSKPTGGQLVSEETPLEPDSRRSGPYVWGKLESEHLAARIAEAQELQLNIVRPGAVVDYSNFDPPGRLGKRIGNLFVAVGSPAQTLGVVDIEFAARAIARLAVDPGDQPDALNLLEPRLPTKRELVACLRRRNPDLRVVWLPMPVLRVLSWLAIGLQKVRRPGRPPLDVAKVFREPKYDLSRIRQFAGAMASREAEGTIDRAEPVTVVGERISADDSCAV